MKYRATIETCVEVEFDSDAHDEENLMLDAMGKLKEIWGTKDCLRELWGNTWVDEVNEVKKEESE